MNYLFLFSNFGIHFDYSYIKQLKMRKNIGLLVFLFAFYFAKADKAFSPVYSMSPPNWFTQMPNKNVQVMIYGNALNNYKIGVSHPGVKLKKITRLANVNYVLVDIEIAPTAKAGTIDFTFKNETINARHGFMLYDKEKSKISVINMTAKKTENINIDRFQNGDDKNDSYLSMNEKTINLNDPTARHGGDFKGFIQYIDTTNSINETAYIFDPIQECNIAKESYKGVPTSHFYRVEPRYGNIFLLQKITEKVHSSNASIQLMMQINNSSEQNQLYIDQPNAWFLNGSTNFNFKNKAVQNYMSEMLVWWAETADLDGISIINSKAIDKKTKGVIEKYFKTYSTKRTLFFKE